MKTFSARPSQNWRWLKTALMTDGVLRGSTRRVFVTDVEAERIELAVVRWWTPCDETTSLLSVRGIERAANAGRREAREREVASA